MRWIALPASLVLPALLWAAAAHARTAQPPLMINLAPPQTTSMVYPMITGFSPYSVVVPIPAAAGTVVTTASVVNSDGSAFAGTLRAGDALFTIQGMNIVLSRATTSADQNTSHSITISAVEPRSVQPQVNVSMQPSAGTIACDIGPPVSSIPAEAQMARLTHCAANWDFGQPLYAQRSNWMNCHWGYGEPVYPAILWYMGSGGVYFPNPCDTINQKYDAAAGKNVMDFEWLAQYGNRGYNLGGHIPQANQVGVETQDNRGNNYSGAPTWTVGNYYIETTARLEGPACNSCAQNSGGPNDVYLGGDSEVDVFELQLDTAKGAHPNGWATGHVSADHSADWGSYAPFNKYVPSDYTPLTYYKYSALHTSDGNTDSRVCLYVNNVLASPKCAVYVPSNFTSRSVVLVSAGSNTGTASQNINLDVQNITVWSCDAHATSMCNGTSLVTRQLPTGQTLSYYH
jgi:hypothetical protein